MRWHDDDDGCITATRRWYQIIGPVNADQLSGLGPATRRHRPQVGPVRSCQYWRVTQTWTASLWDEGAATYRAILEHPFLSGLTSGTLPPDKFKYYLARTAFGTEDPAGAFAAGLPGWSVFPDTDPR